MDRAFLPSLSGTSTVSRTSSRRQLLQAPEPTDNPTTKPTLGPSDETEDTAQNPTADPIPAPTDSPTNVDGYWNDDFVYTDKTSVDLSGSSEIYDIGWYVICS